MYKFLFKKIIKITIKVYLYSLLDDDECFFDIWLMFHSDDFREIPIIPDRGEEYSNNMYSCFKILV